MELESRVAFFLEVADENPVIGLWTQSQEEDGL
jgi:hypothetical protein